jgi:hypothetical protein
MQSSLTFQARKGAHIPRPTHMPAVAPPGPPHACSECDQQYLSIKMQDNYQVFEYSKKIGDTYAVAMASGLVSSTKICLDRVAVMSKAIGIPTQRYWTQLAQKKRRELLIEVDSGMYPNQFGEAIFSIKYRNETQGLKMREYRQWSLLPYLNLEELSSDPAALMNLIYVRIEYSPATWASYDSAKIRCHWYLGFFDLVYNQNCVIMHGERYGQLCKWNPVQAYAGP